MPVDQTALVAPVLGEAGAVYQAKFASLFARASELQSLASGASVNVREYGAVGDGTADDTAAVQAAMDAAFAANLSLYAPSGVYKITAPLEPTLANGRSLGMPGGMRLFGDGMGASQFLFTPATGYCVDFAAEQDHVDSFLCQDFSIRITDAAGSASGMRFPQGGGQRFRRVWFDGAGPTGIGLKLDGVYNAGVFNYHSLIDECRFWNAANFLGQWLYVEGSLALAIRNSFFSVSTFAGNAAHVKTARALHIEDCQFESRHDGTVAGQYLIGLEDVLGATIDTCWFEGLTHTAAIKVLPGARNVVVRNPYHYHDKADGNFIASTCDAPVRVENLLFQAASPGQAVSGDLLNQVSGVGRIEFVGTYVDMSSTTKSLPADVDLGINSDQPAFEAELSAQSVDATGDGTEYTVVCNTEVFDQAANYNNATGVFTAPVTGRYLFSATVYLQGLEVGHTHGYVMLGTSNRSHFIWNGNAAACRDSGNELIVSGSAVADMDAGDQAVLSARIFNGNKTVDVGALYTRFAGALLC